MSRKTKFDIIVPCYNVEHIIEKTLARIFSQEYSKDSFSVIAIDDGSTDNTLRCLNSFSSEQNFTIISLESNKGFLQQGIAE